MKKDLFFTNTFNKWIEKEKKVFLIGKRKYLHFDVRVPFTKKWQAYFYSLFIDAKKGIGHHQFRPFIKADIVTPRYKKTEVLNAQGKPTRELEMKTRPISYASHIDSYIYSWYATYLTELYVPLIKKKNIYDNVLAYIEKDGKSNIQFSKEVFEYIKMYGECSALTFDISSFFDGLDHEILYKKWAQIIKKRRLPLDHYKVFKSLTQYCYVEKQTLDDLFKKRLKDSYKRKARINRYCSSKEFRDIVKLKGHLKMNPFKNNLTGSSRTGHKCGIPQGSPLSACLSNIYMIDFDQKLQKKAAFINGLYYRYCDDIIFVCRSRDAAKIKRFILKTILKYELEINDKKTEIVLFKKTALGLQGFDSNDPSKLKNLQYLGFEFNGRNVYVRPSSMAKYHRRASARIRENLKAAYGKNAIGNSVFRKKLMNRYTDKGQRNFVQYARRASEIMSSSTISKQLRNNHNKIKNMLQKKKLIYETRLIAKRGTIPIMK